MLNSKFLTGKPNYMDTEWGSNHPLFERSEESNGISESPNEVIDVLFRVVKVKASPRTCIYSKMPMEGLSTVVTRPYSYTMLAKKCWMSNKHISSFIPAPIMACSFENE